MGSYTAENVIQLPRLTSPGAVALGEKVLTAAKAHQPALSQGITKALGPLTEAHTILKGALRDQVSLAAAATGMDTTKADRRLDACWGALHDFLSAYARLPDVPQAAEASALKALIFTDGLKFTLLVYELEWSESNTRLERMTTLGLDKRIAALGGSLFLQSLTSAHADYGKALGLTTVQDNAKVPPNLRIAMDGFSTALRKYVSKVIGSVEDDEPETQELADKLLAPLATWDVGPKGIKEPTPDAPDAPPKPPV